MGQPKLLVFGGSGFVGTRVCEEAVKTGLAVVSINRSGPPKLSADWVSSIEWIQVQLLDSEGRHLASHPRQMSRLSFPGSLVCLTAWALHIVLPS